MILHEYDPCPGMNCGCTDGKSHSKECIAEHTAACAGGFFGKWLPIEGAPAGRCLMWVADGGLDKNGCMAQGVVYSYEDGKSKKYRPDGFSGDWDVTHWMPLPPPPSLNE